MRWLFLCLFLLNLAYIGWELSQSSPENYADIPTLKNTKRILLLSELNQPPIDSVETKNVAAEQTDYKQLGSEKVAEQVKKKKVLEIAQEKTGQGDVSLAVNKIAEPLITKDETTKNQFIKGGRVKTKPVEVLASDLSQTEKCFTLGPFRDLGKLRSLTREIKSYVVEADFRGREEREQSLYWVYIKPEKNQVQAIAIGKRLKAKKIKDFYVIRDGEKINGLSLGHFRNKKGAYGLVKKVKTLGFNVIVEPVFKTYTLYWLDYQVASGANIPESVFDRHVKQTKKNNISRLSRDCGV